MASAIQQIKETLKQKGQLKAKYMIYLGANIGWRKNRPNPADLVLRLNYFLEFL